VTAPVRGAIELVAARDWPQEIEPLLALGRGEGWRFVDRLVDEWRSGACRFDGPGEVFLVLREGALARAFGGLARDPYASDPRLGRLQHVFVEPVRRGGGLGGALVYELIARARPRFARLRLRTRHAGPFYEKLGFAVVDEPDTTHALVLEPPCA
jgi:GNAT superfamily N-acetyltransferase